jgi:hypothetical protein
MNPLNYASYEMSKRLYDVGVEIETDMVWFFYMDKWMLIWFGMLDHREGTIPAPTIAKLLQELQGDIYINNKRYRLELWKIGKNDIYGAAYVSQDSRFADEPINNANLADALAELLIWVKEGGYDQFNIKNKE